MSFGVEAPSDDAIGKAFLMIERFGTVSIETLKAFQKLRDMK
jgi:uncharacterized protein with GYD domain